jgi:phenol 2-monooxygenase
MDTEGISMEEYKQVFVKGKIFASGIGEPSVLDLNTRSTYPHANNQPAVDYGKSEVIAKEGEKDQIDSAYRVTSQQFLATGIEVGKLMPSVKILNQSDARQWHFQEPLPRSGRWRVVLLP